VAADNNLYYTSSLTPEAIEREKSAPAAAAWTPAKKLPVAQLYNAKGATFCGQKYSKEAPEGGKYGQLFVAEQGDADNKGRVVGWEVVEDKANPAAIKLQHPWDVYAPENAAPTDVKCGPKDGLFIADKGNKGVYWVTNADLAAKAPNPAYQTVVAAEECGDAAVANVRSLSYDPVNQVLSWSNNDESVVENSGVFEVQQSADGVQPVNCKAKCDAWTKNCVPDVQKVADAKADEKAWAVANAWGGKQVSKGADKVYNAEEKVVADVPKEATYAVAAQDPKRDVLLVSDAQEGAVYAAKQGAAAPGQDRRRAQRVRRRLQQRLGLGGRRRRRRVAARHGRRVARCARPVAVLKAMKKPFLKTQQTLSLALSPHARSSSSRRSSSAW
jgi:hypothetical protein